MKGSSICRRFCGLQASFSHASIAPVRGSSARALGMHGLAAASISPEVGDERQVEVSNGRPPQRCLNDGFVSMPTFAREIATRCVRA